MPHITPRRTLQVLHGHQLPSAPPASLLTLPNELLVEIAKHAATLKDLNSLLRTTSHLRSLLTPDLLKRAVKAPGPVRNIRSVCRYFNPRGALHWAAAHGRVRLVRSLLSHGADAAVPDVYGVTPLYSAAFLGYAEVVEVLLAHGVETEAGDFLSKTTPLDAAVIGGHVDVQRMLEDAGCRRSRRHARQREPRYVLLALHEVDNCEWCRRGFRGRDLCA